MWLSQSPQLKLRQLDLGWQSTPIRLLVSIIGVVMRFLTGIRSLAIIVPGLLLGMTCNGADANNANVAEEVAVTILSSNLANGATIGEWGFSALIEVDGRCVLFDAGNYPDTVLRNAKVLDVDLSCATDVVLSHFHADHTTGLLPLLAELREKNPQAIHQSAIEGKERNLMIAMRKELEAAGVEFVTYTGATEISPAVWVTGPIVRNHAEKTYNPAIRVQIDGEWVEDYVPESQGLTIVTAGGPVVLLGCGHAGSVNLLEQVQRSIQDHSIQAVMGGMHLFSADDQTLLWTSEKLRNVGIQNLMAGHCTGIEPLMRLREGLELTRRTAVVGAVGSRFVYGEGIHPTAIAQ
jgi:7,8-dihydropterin-6-yl-methyl-4-(beta-D-ribofuranosyl)aminobenzene 5'-phosphate synthase